MLIFHRAKLTYLAAPKTGTTAIEAALTPAAGLAFLANPYKHMDLGEYNRFVVPLLRANPDFDPDAFETVCVIREPLDYLGSWYRYQKRGYVREGRSTAGISFPDYIEDVLSDNPPEYAKVRKLSGFIRDGTARVTTILRYGDPLIEDFFAHRLGRYTAFPKRNVSPHLALDPLPTALEDRLRSAWAEEFELFETTTPIDLPPAPRPSTLKRGIGLTKRALAKLR